MGVGGRYNKSETIISPHNSIRPLSNTEGLIGLMTTMIGIELVVWVPVKIYWRNR